jgi:hypothetical protein
MDTISDFGAEVNQNFTSKDIKNRKVTNPRRWPDTAAYPVKAGKGLNRNLTISRFAKVSVYVPILLSPASIIL